MSREITLDELARQYRLGRMIRYQAGSVTAWGYVLGVTWTLPETPGGKDQAGIVVQSKRTGIIGVALPREVVEVAEIGAV
jgi:hypothetical protein